VPLQAQMSGFIIFLKSNAVAMELDGGKYVIVPDSAILLTIRDSIPVVRAPGQNGPASRVSCTTQPSAPAGVSHG
jgi:hypothetical protein